MKHFAAYALLVLGGKAEPSAADVEKVLTAAGLKGDEGKVAALCEAMKGKAFHDVVAGGLAKMATMGSAAPVAAAAETKVEAKKEEAKPEEDEDEGLDGAMDLFGY